MQLGELMIRKLLGAQRMRNHADDFPARAHRRLRDGAHQTDASASVHQPQAALCEQFTHVARHALVNRIAPGIRAAENAESAPRRDRLRIWRWHGLKGAVSQPTLDLIETIVAPERLVVDEDVR